MCNPLLEEEEDESLLNPSGQDDPAPDYLAANLTGNYAPGAFSCGQVWETRFQLHPRLVVSHDPTSKGVASIAATLQVFAVSNRKNMFVFQDENRNVFYLRLQEHASLISRQSSFARGGHPEDDFAGGGSRTSSFGSAAGFRMNLDDASAGNREVGAGAGGSRLAGKTLACDYIDLRAYGVAEPGTNLTKELVAVLQYKLDEKVVDMLSTVLQRNPMTRLGPDDVSFLQKPGATSDSAAAAGTVAHFNYAISKKYRPHLRALKYYLKQNLTCNALFISPKYASSNSEHQFRLYNQRSLDGTPSEGNVYLFNNASRGGHRGIAVVAISMVDKEGEVLAQDVNIDEPLKGIKLP